MGKLEYSGFLVTSQGRIVSFEPANEIDDGDVPYVLVILVALCVPGVFIGLIYWNSPWLQKNMQTCSSVINRVRNNYPTFMCLFVPHIIMEPFEGLDFYDIESL